jgi:hypothetical protein
MLNRVSFSAIDSNQAIDSVSGSIKGVSVITLGEAKGHGLWVDGVALSKLVELAGAQVKVKLNHPESGEAPAFQTTAGMLTNFRVDGDHVRADLELLKSEDYFDKIIEMAQKMPKDFGLSIRVQYDTEEVEGKDYIRPTMIESVDLVDSPAANPNGLFSVKTTEPDKTKNKPMSALIAKALGLAETATEQDVVAELSKRLDAAKPADTSEFSKKIEGFSTKVAELEAKAKEASELARKTEITALVAEASRDGKVIPLTDAQLSKMEVADIKEMITKLPKQVQMGKRPVELPKNKDGARLTGSALVEFCRAKQSEGADALTASFANIK